MKRGGAREGAGRPERDFEQNIFENLCHVHCTISELEAIFQTDQRTIDKWCQRTYGETFSTIYKKFAEGGKAALRRNQMRLSQNNATMAIWLGKVLLGQRDMAEVDEKINRALGVLETAKTLRVVDDRADTITKTDIEHSTGNSTL